MEKERFTSQIGFILTAAGCAIGLGNIYRFPYITGQYGGAIFLVIYIICLIILGLPLLTMEISIGRKSRKSPVHALQAIRPDKKQWTVFQIIQYAANYMFQMFYSTIAAQMLYFTYKTVTGQMRGRSVEEIKNISDNLVQCPLKLGAIMCVIVLIGFLICYGGLASGVEKASKWMLSVLFVLLIVMAVYACTLDGASKGLTFYLKPQLSSLEKAGFYNVFSAAFGQAFFSLGFGSGTLCVMGSYMGYERRIADQSAKIMLLDTMVAFVAGFIVFPACFTYGIEPANGPDLIMVSMSAVFSQMKCGWLLGSLFFIAVLMAALTTVITAYENIVASFMDITGFSRRKSVLLNTIPMILLSIPAVLGFSIWDSVSLMGKNIMGIEDFLVSNNLLPIGAMGYLLFCTRKSGWGWKGFITEANIGEKGLKFPSWLRVYCIYILPVLIFIFWLTGYFH